MEAFFLWPRCIAVPAVGVNIASSPACRWDLLRGPLSLSASNPIRVCLLVSHRLTFRFLQQDFGLFLHVIFWLHFANCKSSRAWLNLMLLLWCEVNTVCSFLTCVVLHQMTQEGKFKNALCSELRSETFQNASNKSVRFRLYILAVNVWGKTLKTNH